MRKFKTQEEIAQEQQIALGLTPVKLPLDKLLVAYGRQSSEKQVVSNKESAAQQAVDLIEYGRMLGWPDEKIQLFIENELMKRIASVSGSLRIDQRPGLQTIVSLIEAGLVGAVLVRSEDRLFRDETHVQDATFADLCKRHNVLIITLKTVYDFNSPNRDDYDRFLDAARESANYVKKHVKVVMLGNRRRKAMRGEYAGHGVPTGLMLDDERKHYIPNPAWAPVIDSLYKRYRQLDADFGALRREIAGKPIFPELPDDLKERVGHITLTKVSGGYTVKSWAGLRYLLTNPAYAGHIYYDGRIVKRNAHPAIVSEGDFNYAFEHLSSVTLDGEPIAHPKRAVRFQHRDAPPSETLLEGIRPNNGEPVLTSPGKQVYVYRKTGARQMAAYVIKDVRAMKPGEETIGSIQASSLDAIFTDRILHHLKLAKLYLEPKPGQDGPPSPITEAYTAEHKAMFEHFQALQQEVQVSLVSVDKSIASTNTRIVTLRRDLDENPTMAQEDRNDIYASLANLRVQLADLQKKKTRENEVAADIQAAKELMLDVNKGWEKLGLEKQRRFVRVATKQIRLELIADGWLQLTVQWSPVLRLQHYDTAYIWRKWGALPAWTDEECAILSEHYATAKRSWLLERLPKRGWDSIVAQAGRIGLHRPLLRSDTDLPNNMSLEDRRVMQANGLVFERPGQSVWWQETEFIILTKEEREQRELGAQGGKWVKVLELGEPMGEQQPTSTNHEEQSR
jgi:DNA invertase Pin-like site-specific DNA recombinase